jgi:hypothetical protein
MRYLALLCLLACSSPVAPASALVVPEASVTLAVPDALSYGEKHARCERELWEYMRGDFNVFMQLYAACMGRA